MTNQLYIYEAGALTYPFKNNLFDKATQWRDKLDKFALDNGILTFNPATTFLKEKNHTYSGAMAVKQNDFYLDKSNIMIVQMDYLDFSPGTQYELTVYKWMKKPVIAFRLDGEPFHWSPHIMSCITETCESIEEIMELLSNMFSQSFK